MREVLFVLVQMFANMVQSLTGFAGGPLAMSPSFLIVGMDTAKAAVTLLLLISTAIVTVQNLKYFNLKKFLFILAYMTVGAIAGLYVYSLLPTAVLMALYGIIVILIGAKRMFLPGGKSLKPPLTYGALLLAGAMQGMFTSGGPFLVLYAADAMKDKNEFRSTISPIWTTMNIFLVANMWRQGLYTPYTLKLVAISIIPMLLAVQAGNLLNDKIDQKSFLKIVYLLLIFSGAVLIVNAIT